jgi:hypothetical protein
MTIQACVVADLVCPISATVARQVSECRPDHVAGNGIVLVAVVSLQSKRFNLAERTF